MVEVAQHDFFGESDFGSSLRGASMDLLQGASMGQAGAMDDVDKLLQAFQPGAFELLICAVPPR